MNSVRSILAKKIDFPVNNYLSNILKSNFFSNLGAVTAIYLLMSYAVSFILWLPLMLPVGVFLGTPILLANEIGVDLPSLFKSSLLLWGLYVFVMRTVPILAGSFIPFLFANKLDRARKNPLPSNLLKIIVLIGTALSYFHFMYSIRDWWFIN